MDMKNKIQEARSKYAENMQTKWKIIDMLENMKDKHYNNKHERVQYLQTIIKLLLTIK